MSRGKCASLKNKARAKKLIDNRYDSEMVTRLIRSIMKDGKASIARTIVYKAMENAAASLPKHVELAEHSDVREKELLVLEKAISVITPRVEVKSRRFGGTNYQVPMMVNKERGTALALRWLVASAQDRPEGKPMYHKLAKEVVATLEGRSGALSKKETQDKVASANRANANLVKREQSQQSEQQGS